ncbi:MAG: glycolate oxidase subunit GlcE [Burkholderiales bacterium]
MTPTLDPATDPELARWVDCVRAARAAGTQLALRGGGTKAFYGEAARGELFDTRALCGISSYQPGELVITARAGTPLAELESALAEQGQCLPFEPPRYAPGGTLGGMVAAGLAGPARATAGSVRDHVLGATLLNGRAEVLSFGGQVIKNVAGYDVSRLLAGSMGLLGAICEVSLKVLPQPLASATLRFELDEAKALQQLHRWGGQPLPLTASAWWRGMLVLRLAGARAAVHAAATALGGEPVEAGDAAAFWRGLRDQQDDFFVQAAQAVAAGGRLWRLSLPVTTAPLGLAGDQLIEWGGAQRWWVSSASDQVVRQAATAAGGQACLFRGELGGEASSRLAPLSPTLARLHRALKQAFDPDGVFNPGRMVPEL